MRTLLIIPLLLLTLGGASAADLKLLTAGAFKSAAVELVPAFERETGHKVIIDNDTAGGLAKRIAGGEAFDVVVLPPADDQLIFLGGHLELLAREARNRERDAQPFRLAVVTSDALDIVGRIAVGPFGDAVERTLDLVEAEQEGT